MITKVPDVRKIEIAMYHNPEDHNVKFHEGLELHTDHRLIFAVLASRVFVAEVSKAIYKKALLLCSSRKRD
jgi:hypothetical protein